MGDSILTTTKKNLGIEETYTAFDPDIMIHLNSVLSTLCQLGIGPENGFMIMDAEPTWVDFLGPDPRLNMARSYAYLRVRVLFDPPGTGYLVQAYKDQILEMEWRLMELGTSVTTDLPTGFGSSLFGVSPFGV